MRRPSKVICCGYSKEPSQLDSSFEHAKQMFKLMDKFSFNVFVYFDLCHEQIFLIFCLLFVDFHP